MKTLEINEVELETLKLAVGASIDSHLEYVSDNTSEEVGIGFLVHLVEIVQLYRKIEMKVEEKQV